MGVTSKRKPKQSHLGCRQTISRLVGSGMLPGRSSHLSSDSCETHFNINLRRMHETLSMIDLTRHPEIWHSSFRKDKGQNFQVSYFLYQQHQLTCSESLCPVIQKVQRLRLAKLARTRFEHAFFWGVSGEMGLRRISLTEDETPSSSCKSFSNTTLREAYPDHII